MLASQRMGRYASNWRRIVGAVALTGAVLLLVLGETVLKHRLGGPKAFLGYWLACFLLTFVAMIMALRELGSVRRLGREDQRDLLEKVLEDVQTEARSRQQDAKTSNGKRN